ncbi:MAG: tripartite tricarboxylate transporter substrate-binding protein [Acidiferrobacterales bacterium]
MAVLAAAAAMCAPVLVAESDYYQGKNVSYIVATNAGGGYDAYARLIGAYLEHYLNADHVIIRNVPGAGHIVGANTLARSKPDGLTIATFNAGLIYGQLQGKSVMRFDLRDFGWIGKAAGEPRAIVVSEKCSIKTMGDLLAAEEPVIFAGAGIGSASYADTRLLSEALGLNIKIIPGYGGTEGEMAMMRGEICAQLASTSSVQGFVDAGYGSYILAIGGVIDGVPNAMEYATTDRARQIVELISALAQLGRITAAPPGTSNAQLNVLRAAYKSALEDPALLAEAKKKGRPIDPAFGDDVKQLVIAALDQTPEIIQIIRKSLSTE